MQPGPGSVCPWVSFHLLEPSVPICQMTRMLACFEEGGAQLSGREHPGDTHISVSSAQKPPSELMFVGTSTPLRLRNSPRVLLSSPCRAPSECVAQENMQSDMVQKHYR
uniref:Uncharacterized protein n=1 Tax=Cercocebus atys TaxID=9531 RepID=A0A2K5P6H6_CERAT